MYLTCTYLSYQDIYQDVVTSNCFVRHTNACRADFFLKFSLMSGLKFTWYGVTSFHPDNLSGLKKNYIQACIVVVARLEKQEIQFTLVQFVLVIYYIFFSLALKNMSNLID